MPNFTPEEITVHIVKIKDRVEGKALLQLLDEYIEASQAALDLSTDPDKPGQVGIRMGELRAYRHLRELLWAELVSEEEDLEE